jgi:hypothetical protein
MRSTDQPPYEEPQSEQYERFIHLLTEIAAVPKAAIYSLDPALRPKAKEAAPGDSEQSHDPEPSGTLES